MYCLQVYLTTAVHQKWRVRLLYWLWVLQMLTVQLYPLRLLMRPLT
jgi:hypothetical protein